MFFRLLTYVTLAFLVASGDAMAQAVKRGTVAYDQTTDDGTFTLPDGRVIPYITSVNVSNPAVANITSDAYSAEISSFDRSFDGTRQFFGSGTQLTHLMNNGTAGQVYTVILDFRGTTSSANIALGIAHLYQLNSVDVIAVPIGGTLSVNPTTGVVDYGSATTRATDLETWKSYRAPTYHEISATNSDYVSFVRAPTVTFTNGTSSTEQYRIASAPPATGNPANLNTTYHFLETTRQDRYDYIVLRFNPLLNDPLLDPTQNTERWNMFLGLVVPEPSGTSLLMLGAAALATRRRRVAA